MRCSIGMEGLKNVSGSFGFLFASRIVAMTSEWSARGESGAVILSCRFCSQASHHVNGL